MRGEIEAHRLQKAQARKGHSLQSRPPAPQSKAGEFPKPDPVSDRRIAWVESEIDEWLSTKIAARNAVPERVRRAVALEADAYYQDASK
jgi:prophage regulatory protein